jgi:serine protease Do
MQESPPLPPCPSPAPLAPARARYPRLSVMVLFLFGLIFLLVVPYLAQEISYSISRGKALGEAEVAREDLAQLPAPENRYRTVVKAIAPSVVAVEMVRLVRGRRSWDDWSGFYQPAIYGQGSGVIVDNEGYIVTNFHVIRGASEVQVTLSNGEVVHSAKVVGADPPSDIAVLKINPGTRKLLAADWGDSDKLEVGDPVLAIGSPYGLAGTVTSGIVSAKGRRGMDPEQGVALHDFLQTDAAVNPGNSGGPLVNLKGQIVGINTAIYGQRYQGIAFAIPSGLAEQVYQKLKAGEPVPRGWLGVGPQEVTSQLAEQLGLEEARGALVREVISNSPAKKAGIQAGDVIVKWGSKRVNNPDDLLFLVASTQPGSQVKVELYRGGQKQVVTVTVGDRPPQLGG